MTAKRTREISAEEVRQWRQVKSPGIRVKTEADQGTYTDPNDPLATQATPESTTPPGRMARSTMGKRIGEQT